MDRSLACVDWLCLSYLVGTSLVLILGEEAGYRIAAGIHLAAAVGIATLKQLRGRSPLLRGLRETYPLVLLVFLYVEADLFVRILHDPPNYDFLVRSWDAWVFGDHPHRYLKHWLPGRFWEEAFHLLYLSYFLLLSGGFFWMWRRYPARFPRFAFVLVGMFMSFVAIFVVFPVAGPLSEPGVRPLSMGWFPRIVSWLYMPTRMDGVTTGAFPSSHVGMSVGVVCLLGPQKWGSRVGLWGLVLGIAFSTVYGQFHYAIDAVAGAIAGGLLYLGWTWVYARVGMSEEAPAQEGTGDS